MRLWKLPQSWSRFGMEAAQSVCGSAHTAKKGGFMMEEIVELLNTGQYLKLRQRITNYNVADIAAYMEKMEQDEVLKLFRILPKSMAADVFSYLEIETEQYIITSMSEKDAANIIDHLMADDATDLLEEMPANVVKRLLAHASA